MFAGPLGRSTFTPPKSSFDSPLYGLVSLRRSQSITLCGVEGEDIGAGQALCLDCAQVGEALNVCGLGPESLRELFDTLRVFGPSEVKAKMEALRGLGVRMDIQVRSQLN